MIDRQRGTQTEARFLSLPKIRGKAKSTRDRGTEGSLALRNGGLTLGMSQWWRRIPECLSGDKVAGCRWSRCRFTGPSSEPRWFQRLGGAYPVLIIWSPLELEGETRLAWRGLGAVGSQEKNALGTLGRRPRGQNLSGPLPCLTSKRKPTAQPSPYLWAPLSRTGPICQLPKCHPRTLMISY